MSRKLIVQQFLTLDGVMQAPGAKDEDTRGGFEHGGWQLSYYDNLLVEFMLKSYASADALLFGRRTYDTFAAYWPSAPDDGNPFIKDMNRLTKYVVSTRPLELKWKNSAKIEGDAVEEITKLKRQPGKDIILLGSGKLSQTLMQHNLVDKYTLFVAPLILGTGTRLFSGSDLKQELVFQDSKTTSTGVVIMTYTAL